MTSSCRITRSGLDYRLPNWELPCGANGKRGFQVSRWTRCARGATCHFRCFLCGWLGPRMWAPSERQLHPTDRETHARTHARTPSNAALSRRQDCVASVIAAICPYDKWTPCLSIPPPWTLLSSFLLRGYSLSLVFSPLFRPRHVICLVSHL